MTLTEISSFGKNEGNLTLPSLPEEYLDVIVIDNDDHDIEEIVESYPLAISDVTSAKLVEAKKLSSGEDVKETYSIELSHSSFARLTTTGILTPALEFYSTRGLSPGGIFSDRIIKTGVWKFSTYQPGDTIGIVTQNANETIQRLFNNLKISNLSKKKCKVCLKSSTVKLAAKPVYLDKITTLEHIFTYYLDIYCIPKKTLIRLLAEFTKDLKEKRYLEELCSKEKSDLYGKEILEANTTFLDLLFKLQSCSPPVARLLENLPKLQPRPYSIASSPLSSPNKLRIVFSVVTCGNEVKREGLCTGMLKNIINSDNKENFSVKIFLRKCNGFNLPESSVPLILVGPGTGVAPFIGFLEHRKHQDKKGKIWLFYGCRHKAKDYLFENELQEYLNSGVLTRLSVAFSRDSDSESKYVQDNIKKYGKEVCDLVFEENAMIYVCGDAKNMRKDIQNAFIELFENHKGMTNSEALNYIKKLQKEKRYFQDIWL